MSKNLPSEEQTELFQTLQNRFEENEHRHVGIEWSKVRAKLEKNSDKLWSVHQMEVTGGEPDVVGYDDKADEYIFVDCVKESPKERRSVCYDQVALEARKQHKPRTSAMAMSEEMGVDILTEEQYRELQKLGEFDLKTSSWIETPAAIRRLGGALFCDRRYDSVFTYHNGADSYYAARGFRGSLRV